jgi:hypothetical protein
MNNIHLHSDNHPKGILKDNINKRDEVVSSILPSVIFQEDDIDYTTPSPIESILEADIPVEPINRLNELKEYETMQKLNSLIRRMTGFSCVAEYNYYRNQGG